MSGLDEALSDAVLGATKKWAKQRKAEERSQRARYRRSQAFQPRAWTLKAAAEECMEEAYMKASAGDTLPANARQIMYAARPYIQDRTGKDLNSNYFTQTLLPDYMAEHATAGWNVVYDARGHFHEPHTDKTVALGTIEVRNYLHAKPDADSTVKRLSLDYPTSGPRHRFGATLFIEKEGFDELLAAAKIAERYDIAIMSTKGMSVTAARELVESLGHPLLVLHDFDQAGFSIIGTLRRSTRRYRFNSRPDVIDAGLRLSDIEELGLGVEYQACDHSPEVLWKNGASAADIDFLKSGRRVELNAMTSDQLVDLIESRLEEAGVEKVVPDSETLEMAYRRAYKLTLLNEAIAEATDDADQRAKNISVPMDLERHVRESLETDPTSPWDHVVADMVGEAIPEDRMTWHTSWDVNPPAPGDSQYDAYIEALPAEADRLEALYAEAEPALPIEPTTYSNGYASVTPPDAEPTPTTAARLTSLEDRSIVEAKYGVRTLSAIPSDPPHPLILDRMAPDGHTILFGDGGIGKGVISSSWISGLVALGHDVLVVDYENNPGEWSRRVTGLGGPETAEHVHHVAPTAKTWHGGPGAFWEHVDDIGELAVTYNASVVVIDSIIIGCHGFDPSDSESASSYSAAVAHLERPVLSIGHNTKAGAGRYPFGSVVWHNAARLTWSLERVAGGLLLRCRKSNNYRMPPRHLVSMTWRDDIPREVWEKPYAAALEDQVLDVLEDEAMELGPLTERLNADNDDGETPVKKDAVRQVLQRAKKRELVVLEGGLWKR